MSSLYIINQCYEKMNTVCVPNEVDPQWKFQDSEPTINSRVPMWMILYIFKKLEFNDLCNTAQVCKAWRHLSNKDALWKPLLLQQFSQEAAAGGAKGWFVALYVCKNEEKVTEPVTPFSFDEPDLSPQPNPSGFELDSTITETVDPNIENVITFFSMPDNRSSNNNLPF